MVNLLKIKDLNFESNVLIKPDDALIIVDMQNDFIPGGSFPVEEGDQIVEGINRIAELFKKNSASIIFC